jgi:hypothetical protein
MKFSHSKFVFVDEMFFYFLFIYICLQKWDSNNAAIQYVENTIKDLPIIIQKLETIKFIPQLTIIFNFNIYFNKFTSESIEGEKYELLINIIQYIKQHFKYIHTLIIDCQKSQIPVQIWNECSLISTLTSFSIINLEILNEQNQYNYWSNMNICTSLTKYH